MCLTSVSEELPEDSGAGWALFVDGETRLGPKGLFSVIANSGPFLPGVEDKAQCGFPWHISEDHGDYCGIHYGDGHYLAGFHIFLSRKDVERYNATFFGKSFVGRRLVIREVTYRGAYIKGTQGLSDVIVAKYRTIKED